MIRIRLKHKVSIFQFKQIVLQLFSDYIHNLKYIYFFREIFFRIYTSSYKSVCMCGTWYEWILWATTFRLILTIIYEIVMRILFTIYRMRAVLFYYEVKFVTCVYCRCVFTIDMAAQFIIK